MSVQLTIEKAQTLVGLAMACVHREFPNHVQHYFRDEKDLQLPRDMHPIFYGCLDWHSAVHNHWLLLRALRIFPKAPFATQVAQTLDQSFTPKKALAEKVYFEGVHRTRFEFPYGTAWYLTLWAELLELEHPHAKAWQLALLPLSEFMLETFAANVQKLQWADRSGQHGQTAFGLTLALDAAAKLKDQRLEKTIKEKAQFFFKGDPPAELTAERAPADFLSPTLSAADLMRRVLDSVEFESWLCRVIPNLPQSDQASWLVPVDVTDPENYKLIHGEGLNLSRAWQLRGLAEALPQGDPRCGVLRACATAHAQKAAPAIAGSNYGGTHWLPSFAMYLHTDMWRAQT